MPAGVGQDDRIVRSGLAQGRVNGQAVDIGIGLAIPFLLVPAAADDRFAGLGLLGRGGHKGHDVVPAMGLRQVQAQLGFAEARKMHMGVDPARSRQLAAEIDDLGGRADIPRNRSARPHRFDAVAPNSQSLDFRPGRIHRDDAAIGQDEIGGRQLLRRGRSRGGRENGPAKGQDQASQAESGHGGTFLLDSILQ